MSESVKKPKIGQRIVRALFIGNMIGFVLFLVSYFLTTAINGVADQDVLPAVPLSLGGYGMGLAASIGIELSKDIET